MFISSIVKLSSSSFPDFTLMISSTISIFQSSPSGMLLYGMLLTLMSHSCNTSLARRSLRILRPVIDRQSFSISRRTRRSTSLRLFLTLSTKFINLFFIDFEICSVFDRDYMKYLCVVLGIFSMILCETFHVFSNFSKSFE